MKTTVTLGIAYLLCIGIAKSQNLVINPGAEDTVQCPWQIGQVNFTNGWDTWRGTPDFYHSCGTWPVSSPSGFTGYQQPHSGSGKFGLFTFSNLSPNLREYIGGTLSMPLLAGQMYYVSFWVSHGDTSYILRATDKLGIKFSTAAYSLLNPDTSNNAPHFFTTSVITDTAGWVLIGGSFIADSNYTHFGIGNYFVDSLTTVINFGGPNAQYAYYFIDDICVSVDSVTCFGEWTSVAVTGLQREFSLFPNPSSDFLKVKMPFDDCMHIKIYDATGGCTWNGKVNAEVTIPIHQWAEGIYSVHASNGKHIFMKKLVVLRL